MLNEKTIYDVAIIGGGPGGLSAAIYALRYNLKVVLFEKFTVGGQAAETSMIENYPGAEKMTGYELGVKMHKQAEGFGLKTEFAEVAQARLEGNIKELTTLKGTFYARTVILTMGAFAKQLGVAGEKELLGRGVSYCATCDGALFRGRVVAMVGGGNSATEDAIYLAGLAKKVFLIHRRDSFRADGVTALQIERGVKGLEPVYSSVVTEIVGSERLEKIKVKNLVSGEEKYLEVEGLFIEIGKKPDTSLTAGQIATDERGYIVVDKFQKTNLPGVFAAGDVTNNFLKQVVTAAAEGAVAATSAKNYILEQKDKK